MQLTTDESRAASFFGLVLEGTGFAGKVPSHVWDELKATHQERNLWRVVLPGVPEALARLRASGLRLAVVSNANGTVKALFTELGLASSFDVLVDSFVEGVEKPDPEIFRRALSRLGASASRALHVGDFYHLDVVGARAAGVAAALVDSADLYESCDAPRFRSLPALVDALLGPAVR
jgi:putative hydrolase of the HAD superfamily